MESNRLKIVKRWAVDIVFWSVGSILYAVAINMFTAPNNILVGGFSGIATMLNYLFNTPIGTVVFVLNIPFFIISFKKFGFTFIIRTVIATFIASFFIDFTAPFLVPYSGDKLLASLFGGVAAGGGLGLIFISGATTGGTDIIAKLLRLRFAHISMGRVILFLDLAVIAASYFVYGSLESMLYALIVIFVSSQAIDYMLSGTGHNKILFIVTDMADSTVKRITDSLHRGATIVPVLGGYTNKEKKMIICAVRANEVPQFSKAIKEIDDKSFMVVAEAGEILGEGFRHNKM